MNDVNSLPLNQAALTRLKLEGLELNPNRSHLLQLAISSLEDENDPRAGALTYYDLSWPGQAYAHQQLSRDLQPEDVISLPLSQLLSAVHQTLQKPPPRD